jgi:hypothetical protein
MLMRWIGWNGIRCGNTLDVNILFGYPVMCTRLLEYNLYIKNEKMKTIQTLIFGLHSFVIVCVEKTLFQGYESALPV